MPFRRDNSNDPRLMSDLALLAGEGERPGATDEEEVMTGADPSPLDDPFVRRFVQVAAHGRRYLAHYVGAFAWLGVLLLMQPVGRDATVAPPRADVRLVTSADAPGGTSDAGPGLAEDTTAEVSDEFSDTTFGGTSFSATDLVGGGPIDDPGFRADGAAAPGGTTAGTPGGDAASGGGTETFPDPSDELASEGPQPLTITRSGYASSTGGTPLEQPPPEDGLPVSAAAGQTNKASFIALAGDEVLLRLKPVAASTGSLNAERAGIRACRITQRDWQAGRGQPMGKAPRYAATECATGSRSANGVWSFDLTDFGDIDTVHGLALVPVPDPTLEFLVTFRPFAERGS